MTERFEAFQNGITVCYKYIQRIKNMEMTEFGLKGIHASCLYYLYHSPEGLTASQLCTLCWEDKATVSRIVADLRSRGFIQAGTGKNYRAPLQLSQQGQQIAQRMDPVIASWAAVGGEGLSDGERESFYRSLHHIAENLKKKMERSYGD